MEIKPHDFFDLTEEDVYEAMKEMDGYTDITPSDFRKLYAIAYRHMMFRIQNNILAQDIMTKKVVYVYENTRLKDVAISMIDNGVSGVPVVDRSMKVLGVISEKDFLTRFLGEKAGSSMLIFIYLSEGRTFFYDLNEKTAGDIMSKPAVTAHEKTPVSKIIGLLADHRINRIPIVDSEGRLKGIVTRNNLFDPSCRMTFLLERMDR